MRGKRPAQHPSTGEGGYFAAGHEPQREDKLARGSQPPVMVKQEDLWEDVRSTSSSVKPSAPQPLPITDDRKKREREGENPAAAMAGGTTSQRLLSPAKDPRLAIQAARKAQKTTPSSSYSAAAAAAPIKSILKTSASSAPAASAQRTAETSQPAKQYNCLLVDHGGAEYKCDLAHVPESTNAEVNENTANAKRKIMRKWESQDSGGGGGGGGGGGAFKIEVCGPHEELKLGSGTGETSDPFLVMQLACRGLGPVLYLCGSHLSQLCQRNFEQKKVMKVHLDDDHKLYLVSLRTCRMYGFLVKEDERSGSMRPSLTQNIVLKTMIGEKINVGFDLGILLKGESIENLNTNKEKMLEHMKQNDLYKYFSEIKMRKYSSIRYYAKKKETDHLVDLLPRYMKENLLDIPDNSSSDEDLDLSATSYPLTVMFGESDHNNKCVETLGDFVKEVQSHFYRDVNGTLIDCVKNFLKNPENSVMSLLENDWSFDTIVKEKRDKLKIQLNADSRMRSRQVADVRRPEPSRSVPQPRQRPQMNHNHMPRPNEVQAPPYINEMMVTEQRVWNTPQQQTSPFLSMMSQPKFSENADFKNLANLLNNLDPEVLKSTVSFLTILSQPKFSEDADVKQLASLMNNLNPENLKGAVPLLTMLSQPKFSEDANVGNILRSLNGLESDVFHRALKDILIWMQDEHQSNDQMQNNDAQLLPAGQQHYNQHNQLMMHQGVEDFGYPTIDPQPTDAAYINKIKSLFPPLTSGYGRGPLGPYNCIRINLSGPQWDYVMSLPKNKSEGKKQTSNMGRLQEYLNQVPSKSVEASILGIDVCYYNAYAIVKVGPKDNQIPLGIGLGRKHKIAKQAAAKVVLETVFNIDTLDVNVD